MKVDVLLGLQWGDEGKGKIVDVLCPKYDVIARFQGGPNAGHTLEFDGEKYVLNTIPSGIFNPSTINLIGNGVVIDPAILKREIENLNKAGVDPIASGKLLIARRAHLILPTHRLLDAASEAKMGLQKIGSTLKGIGPTYADKIGRNGLRVGDIMSPDFMHRYKKHRDAHLRILDEQRYEYNLQELEPQFLEGIELLKTIKQVDGDHFLNKCLIEGKKILAEGAQGTMLDVDFGSYPYVTSSNTTAAGACTGLGIAPDKIGEVIGIFKAYCTRVGGGPFPTELDNETGELLRKIGNEFGATTGRPRRCGWIDLPALKYAIMLNGVSKTVMTKADVLSGFDTIEVCTHYICDGEKIDFMPYDIVNSNITPVTIKMEGWNENLTATVHPEQLPESLLNYISYLEKELGVPINYLSVGPDRKQTLTLKL